MHLLSPFKTKSLIGLDIHPKEIRLMGVRKRKNQIYLDRWGIKEMPPNTIEEGKIKSPGHLIHSIKEMTEETDLKGADVAIALPFSDVIRKRIKLSSYLKESNRESEILANLNHYLPGMKEKLCIDFVTLAQIDQDFDDVLLVAARQEQVNEYVHIVEQAGLFVKKIDVDVFAWLHGIHYLFPSASKNTVAILEVNFTDAQFIVFHAGEMIFTQQWIFQNSLNQQLKNIFHLFFSTHKNITLDLIILWGKSVSLSDLKFFMEEEFSVRTECAQPFFSDLKEMALRMLTSYGLAMRGIN